MQFYQSTTTTTTPTQTPFGHFMTMLPSTSGAPAPSTGISDTVKFDSQPASPAFLSGYTKCVALYLSYLITHPEWVSTPGRALIRAMETRLETPAACQVFSDICSHMEYILNRISWMRFRETEYMLALGLLERFLESTKVPEDPTKRYILTTSSVPMTILVSLMTANKLSDDRSCRNVGYCQMFSIPLADLNTSEINFLNCLHMNLSFTEAQLVELVKICESSLKMF